MGGVEIRVSDSRGEEEEIRGDKIGGVRRREEEEEIRGKEEEKTESVK